MVLVSSPRLLLFFFFLRVVIVVSGGVGVGVLVEMVVFVTLSCCLVARRVQVITGRYTCCNLPLQRLRRSTPLSMTNMRRSLQQLKNDTSF